MKLIHVILGQVVTEKSQNAQSGTKRVYTLKVSPNATKIDIKNALKELYDVEALQVRMIVSPHKTRLIGRGKTIEKRHRTKKAIVTLSPESKALDIAA